MTVFAPSRMMRIGAWGFFVSLVICLIAGAMMIGEGEPGAVTVLSGAVALIFAGIWLVGAAARRRRDRAQGADG